MKSALRAAFRALPAALLLGLLAAPALQAATLEGSWRLEEQRVGSGPGNLATPEAPLRLEFRLSGASLAGRIWTAEQSPRPLPWPSFSTERGPVPVRIEELVFSPAGDAVRAVYQVAAPGGGKEALRVEEDYRLAEGGKALVGTVTLTSLEEGSPRGSYRIRRRFVREPGGP